MGDKQALLIAGPTASGKSAAARVLADQAVASGRKAWIVNADSMQVYGALRLLTARPSEKDEASLPHRLYGHVPAPVRYSVAAWLEDLAQVLAEAAAANALPIIVGGTGLYFKALTDGLAPTPPVPPEVRAKWLEILAAEGAEALHARLGERDALAAVSIRPGDAQRIVRALEVLDGTGLTLAAWQQAQSAPPLLPEGQAATLVIEPDRAELYRRIEQRFDSMVSEGALDEVEALVRRELPTDLPVMKAIGVRQFARFLRHECSLSEAIRDAKTETRRYAKRQLTWFRNQMSDWPRVTA